MIIGYRGTETAESFKQGRGITYHYLGQSLKKKLLEESGIEQGLTNQCWKS